jgi:homoserine O-succinyltransferase
MPLVAHSDLPTFARLREQGQQVIPLSRALGQDIRELHIGLLNMMPDAALAATEQQFIRMVGNCNQIAQFYVYPFSLPGLLREEQGKEHIRKYYSSFEELQETGLDALIITGANVTNPTLDQERFWEPLIEVVKWASANVASTLCSCLATHALLKYFFNIEREPLPDKKWGVYSHRVNHPLHPLVRGVNTRFDAPHSRWNAITRAHCVQAGLVVLAESPEAGVHLAVDSDLFSHVFFQGHPEYDGNSLLKEYKREVKRFLGDELEVAPPFPENYFSSEARDIADKFISSALQARQRGQAIPEFPETSLTALVDNTWGDTGKAIINNWLGLVYQLTSLDRRKRYMNGVNQDDPLGMRSQIEAEE